MALRQQQDAARVRHLLIHQLLPVAPARITVVALQEALADRGIAVVRRTIELDLARIALVYALVSDDSKPMGWAKLSGSEPSVDDPQTRLWMQVLSHRLEGVLPRSALAATARHSPLAGYLDKVRDVPRGFVLCPASTDPAVLGAVCTGVFENRRLRISYRGRDSKRGRVYDVSPLGLLLRGSSVHVVTALASGAVRQFVAHRMETATVLPESGKAPPDWDFDAYIASGTAGFAVDSDPIQLVLALKAEAAGLLRETAMSEDQTIRDLDDGRVEVRASVPNTMELRAWIAGFRDAAEVMGPPSLREEFARWTNKLARRYGDCAIALSERPPP